MAGRSGDPAPRGAHSGALASLAGMNPWLAASLSPWPALSGGGPSAAASAPSLPGSIIPLGAGGGGGSRLA